MFDKKRFKYLVDKAIGDRKISQFSSDSGVNRTYISKYVNERLDNPPTPDVLKRLANASQNDISYEELMSAAGYLDDKDYEESILKDNKDLYTASLTKKDERDIEKDIEKLTKDWSNIEGLSLSGEAVSEEALDAIKESIALAVRQAKVINKKYTPKKYRKNDKDDK